MKPRIFISAVTSELGTTRQLVANALLRLGYDPVTQDIFGTESGDLRQMLRDKIDDCDGLVQLVGNGYGAEPPTSGEEFAHDGFVRVSYTQLMSGMIAFLLKRKLLLRKQPRTLDGLSPDLLTNLWQNTQVLISSPPADLLRINVMIVRKRLPISSSFIGAELPRSKISKNDLFRYSAATCRRFLFSLTNWIDADPTMQ